MYDYTNKKITFSDYVKNNLKNYFENWFKFTSLIWNSDIEYLYWEFLKNLFEYKKILFKKYIKNLLEERKTNYSYKWNYFFSYLTDQDISNSLQIQEDILQEFLKNNLFVFFDDWFIKKYENLNKIFIKKKYKKHNLKNFCFFSIKKI